MTEAFQPSCYCCAIRRLLHDDQKESGLLPVLARLIKQFVFKYQSKEHAKDLVQALHVVLRLLERLSRNGPSEDLPPRVDCLIASCLWHILCLKA